MTTATTNLLAILAKDLSKDFPRSPREVLGGYVIAARALDKCRAEVNGTAGEYHFNCALDRIFFDFSGIDAEAFKAFVATGATDDEVAAWIGEQATPRERIEVIKWNNHYRYMRLNEAPDRVQEVMEDYIAQYVPRHKPVYHWFDVYDLEEQRI